MPKNSVDKPITDREMTYATYLLAGELTDREAATAAGINAGMAAYYKALPRVKKYMEDHRASVRAGLVEHEVGVLVEFNIGREQLLAKAWEFACIDPKLTGYNTSGQSKALDFVWRALGYDGPAKPAEEEPAEKPQIYKAKWLRELEGLDTDDLEVEEAIRRAAPVPTAEPSEPFRQAAPEQPPAFAATRPTAPVSFREAETPEQPLRMRGAAFGRFQGL